MKIDKNHRRIIACVLTLALLGSPGCSILKKRHGSELAVSDSSGPVVGEGSPPADSNRFLNRTKAFICGTGKVIGGTIVIVGAFALKSWLDDDDDEDEPIGFNSDHLWHAGYGFNNPNNERIRNGEPLLNFDGSVAD